MKNDNDNDNQPTDLTGFVLICFGMIAIHTGLLIMVIINELTQ